MIYSMIYYAGSLEGSTLNVQSMVDAMMTIRQNLDDFMITLTEEDRRTLLKMGNASKPFVEKTMEFMDSNPEFISPLIKTEEMRSKFELIQLLIPFFRELKQISRNLDDTLMMLGSDVMVSANDYYHSVKRAKSMRIKNAQPIYLELHKRYQRKPNRAPKEMDNAA
jgi:hypothetical protein